MTKPTERAAREAEAADLLGQGLPGSAVVLLLQRRHGVSRATAHRYVHAATAASPTPDPDLDLDCNDATAAIAIAHREMLLAMADGDPDRALKWGRVFELNRRRNGLKV